MSNVQKYAVVEVATGKIVNIALWDGATTWPLSALFSVRLAALQDEINLQITNEVPP